MGLNAVVYRSIDSLKQLYPDASFKAIDRTGEAASLAAGVVIPSTVLKAIDVRIGNVARVASLHGTISLMFPDTDSILCGKVLYSGSHSGDFIERQDIPRLKIEIAFIKQSAHPDLTEFVQDLESLVAASDAELNPIVFV